MSENTIKYKNEWLSYSKVADALILDYGCNSLKLLSTLLYISTGKVLCEAELSIISDCYINRVNSIKYLMNKYSE